MTSTWIALAVLCLSMSAGVDLAKGAELPLVFEDDFEKGADNWQPTDAKAWKFVVLPEGTKLP